MYIRTLSGPQVSVTDKGLVTKRVMVTLLPVAKDVVTLRRDL